MGSTGDSSNSINTILILGDNFPAPPIIHALSHYPGNHNDYSIHIAHPYTPEHKHSKVTYHTCKPASSSLSPLLEDLKPDIVIDTTPGPFESKKGIIDALVAAGVPRFIPCEFAHDSLNPGIQARLSPSKEKAKTVEYLRQLSNDGEGTGRLEWCGVAVGVVLDRGLLSGNLGFDLAWRNATMHGSGDEKFAASSEAWVGQCVLSLLDHWDDVAVGGTARYLYAAGMITSANDVLRRLEDAMEMGDGNGSGSREWTADRDQQVEDCVREARQRIERGFPDAGMFLMERSVLYDESLDAAGAFEREDAGEALCMLGLGEGEDLDEVIGAVVHEYEHHGGMKAGCGCD